jgi:hypothetical protein
MTHNQICKKKLTQRVVGLDAIVPYNEIVKNIFLWGHNWCARLDGGELFIQYTRDGEFNRRSSSLESNSVFCRSWFVYFAV